ncbi:MAG: acyltransferase [Thiotrichales bacterium]
MGLTTELRRKIVARETPFFDGLYRFAKSAFHANVPLPTQFYQPLRWERDVRRFTWRWFKNYIYNEPVFRTYCSRCGANLRLFDGIPKVFGAVEIQIGNRVGLEGEMVVAGGKLHPNPTLEIGDDTYLGYKTCIFISDKVSFGNHVLVANEVFFAGYDSHPLDPIRRANNEPPDARGGGPIRVDDYAWIGSHSIILKNVTIGKGAIVGAGSVVTRDVEPLTVVAGNPARVVKRLDQYRHYFPEMVLSGDDAEGKPPL